MTIILRALITIMSLLGIVPATAIGADPPTAPPPPVRRPSGITSETEQAINRGLAYLVRRQDHQGSWANRDGHGEYTVAMTALAGLALVMDGNTTTQGRYAPQVDRATKFLLDSAGSNGLISRGKYDSRPMYGHGFAMLFFGQVYGMTEDAARAREIHHALSGGVNLIARAQSRLGGWYYTSDSGNDEGSVTVTQIQALRSCRNAGVAVPKTVIDTAMDYLAQSQNEDGGIRYMVSQRSGASRPAITAAAVCCWYNAGQYDTPRSRRALDFCKDRIPLRGDCSGQL